MPFNGEMSLRVFAEMTGSLDIEALRSKIDRTWKVSLGDGVGAGQAQRMFSDTRTLASGASESLDLNGAGLLDAFGNAITFTKVKGILIAADLANTTVLTIGNVTNGIVSPFLAATGGVIVPPGGMFFSATPDVTAFGITAATADLLKVANAAGAAANYDVVLIGVG